MQMENTFTENYKEHIDFSYTCFDRMILRGYISSLFMEGSVINLFKNLGFKKHSNGVLKTFSEKLNSHIKKVAEKNGITIHWWSKEEKTKYNSKIDFVKEKYQELIKQKQTSNKVICIIIMGKLF